MSELNFLTDEEDISGKRDVVRHKNTENTMGRAYEQ